MKTLTFRYAVLSGLAAIAGNTAIDAGGGLLLGFFWSLVAVLFAILAIGTQLWGKP